MFLLIEEGSAGWLFRWFSLGVTRVAVTKWWPRLQHQRWLLVPCGGWLESCVQMGGSDGEASLFLYRVSLVSLFLCGLSTWFLYMAFSIQLAELCNVAERLPKVHEKKLSGLFQGLFNARMVCHFYHILLVEGSHRSVQYSMWKQITQRHE